MGKKVITIIRISASDKQTIGIGHVTEGEKLLYTFRTLELPWKDNQRNVSCVPAGKYKAFKRVSPSRDMLVIELKDVPGRSHIQIHPGNYHTDILGCILPGNDIADINADGYADVIYSRNAFYTIMNHTPDEFVVHIFELYE